MQSIDFSEKDMIEIQNILRERKQTITVAESCTGGLIASKITSVSGSSDIFNGSIVSYSNDIKEKELNVKKEDLIKYGAVSEEVVSQMLDGVLNKFDADYAIATSGIAGPTGGSDKKPVGTVIFGISSKTKKYIEKAHFIGSRTEVQEMATKKILNFLQILLKNP